MKNNRNAFVIIIVAFFSACSAATGSDPKNKSETASNGGSGSDLYYEYTITSSGKNVEMNGYLKMYISAKGNVRLERSMVTNFAGKKNTVSFIVIGNADKPEESIIIDDDQKTYTVNHINSEEMNTASIKKSTASKIGEEKTSGYNSVHARVISISTLANDTLDIWKSNDVPVPAFYKKLSAMLEAKAGNLVYSQEAAQQLKQMGCDGFLVKLEIKGKKIITTQQLVKTEKRNIPDEMFRIPAGYKEDKDGI